MLLKPEYSRVDNSITVSQENYDYRLWLNLFILNISDIFERRLTVESNELCYLFDNEAAVYRSVYG